MSSPPPPYPGGNQPRDTLWRLRNAKYRSFFTANDGPSILEFREHLDCLKDSLSGYTRGIGNPICVHEEHPVLEVQYSQTFENIERLIDEYGDCVSNIHPLSEEDVLFLLLSRYAESSGTKVYAEIHRDENIQIFDSSISEPLHVSTMTENLVYGSGMINADILVERLPDCPLGSLVASSAGSSVGSPVTPPSDIILEFGQYLPLPQTPSRAPKECSVTLNFPAVFAVGTQLERRGVQESRASNEDNKCQVSDRESNSRNQVLFPEKLQPPPFCVHRCHHRGVVRGGEDQDFILPLGFPEIIHHLYDAPEEFHHIGFYISDTTRDSQPHHDSDVMAYECEILSLKLFIYVTVQRHGERLAYDCFRDKEAWIASHPFHEECCGC